MVKKSLLILTLVLTLFLTGDSLLQQNGVDEKQKELDKIKKELADLRAEIKESEKTEKKSYEAIERYNRQVHLVNKMIAALENEERLVSAKIIETDLMISQLESKVKLLKQKYAAYIIAVYKNLDSDPLLFILDSDSFLNAIEKYTYYRMFTESGKRANEQLGKTINSLNDLKSSLQTDKIQKEKLKEEKELEENNLKAGIDAQQKVIKEVKKDKNALEKEYTAKKKAETEIKSYITNLIDKEKREKKEREANTKTDSKKTESGKTTAKTETKKEPANYGSSKNEPEFTVEVIEEETAVTPGYSGSKLSTLKGKLIRPVTGGTVIREFGENKNVKLNTVTYNYGIDIKLNSAAAVRTVADGKVSIIEYVAGYGTIIIITHSEGFRTVYGHLGKVNIKTGETLKGGTVIGYVGESLEGFILHFEIWQNRTNLNPKTWLAAK